VTEQFDELVDYAEAQMNVIGPAFGGDAQLVMEAVAGQTREQLEATDFTVEVDGESYELDDEMVAFHAEPPEGIVATDFEDGTVYVDTELTDELEAEGYARDVIRRIQEMRKQLDLDVEEPIHTAVDVGDERVAAFVDRHGDLVAEETRSVEFETDVEFGGEADYDLLEEWEIEGVEVTIGVDRIEAEA
jgi:isoleucyl-tRNA synthetase